MMFKKSNFIKNLFINHEKLLTSLAFLLICFANAQQLDSIQPAPKLDSLKLEDTKVDSLKLNYQAKKYILKLSLTSLAFRNIHLQYERIIDKRVSASLSASTISKGELPFITRAESLIDDVDVFDKLKDVKVSYWSITPEVRIYLGKKGHGKGFFIGPFYSNSKLSLEGVKFEYDNDQGGKTSISTSGSTKGNTVGLLIGSQFNLGKSIVLDWWIVGPHYGSGGGALVGEGSQRFSQDEKNALLEELNELDLPLVDETTEVSDQDIKVTFSGPWGGVRAGISLGFRF